jgi:hypothetical protein
MFMIIGLSSLTMAQGDIFGSSTLLDITGWPIPTQVISDDFNSDGYPDIAFGHGGGDSIRVILNDGAGGFGNPIFYRSSNRPENLVTADFDGDGDLDIATGSNGFTPTLSVLLNDGDGVFTNRKESGSGKIVSMDGADLDGDSAIDLVYLSAGHVVYSMLNNGDATFSGPYRLLAGVGGGGTVLVDDFNGDGHHDVVVSSFSNERLTILFNNGNGVFVDTLVDSLGESGGYAYGDDFDDDGDLDLAVLFRTGERGVMILLNHGDGTFADAVVDTTGPDLFPNGVNGADFDGDGSIDLVMGLNTGNNTEKYLAVLLNDGTGKFGEPIKYQMAGQVRSVVAADVDQDGDNDLVSSFVGGAGPHAAVTLNSGEGRFEARMNYNVGGSPRAVIAADLDRDGMNDIVTANYTDSSISILMNKGEGLFEESVRFEVVFYYPYGPTSVAAADLDGDSAIDLAVGCLRSGGVYVLRNTGDGTFENYGLCFADHQVKDIIVADLDSDDDYDLVTVGGSGYNVSIFQNDGTGNFVKTARYSIDGALNSLCAGDFDNDDDVDLATADYYGDKVAVIFNDGFSVFADPVYFQTGQYPYSMFAADFDGDSAIDLATANHQSDDISILANAGDGTFGVAQSYPIGTIPFSIYGADFDGDGDCDLVTANWYADNIAVLLNDATGSFGSPVTYRMDNTPSSVFAADLDGDGDNDIMATNTYYPNPPYATFSIYFNKTNTQFNQAPVLSYIGPQTVNEGTLLSFAVTATDPDGTIPTLSTSELHAGAAFTDNGDGTGQFEWTPGYTQAGIYTVTFTASDGVDNAAEAVEITVIHAPCGDVNDDGTVDLGDVLTMKNHLFPGNDAPSPVTDGDVNCSGAIDVGDMVHLIQYIFAQGTPPCCQ